MTVFFLNCKEQKPDYFGLKKFNGIYKHFF